MNSQHPIFNAINDNNIDKITNLLKENKDVLTMLNAEQKTPLHFACYKLRWQLAQILFDEILKKDPFAVKNSQYQFNQALIIAIQYHHYYFAGELLRMGVSCQNCDANGKIPLYHAIIKHDALMVELLLSFGANPSVLNTDNQNMIEFAKDIKAYRCEVKMQVHLIKQKKLLQSSSSPQAKINNELKEFLTNILYGYIFCIPVSRKGILNSISNFFNSQQNIDEEEINAVKAEIDRIKDKKFSDFDELNKTFIRALSLLSHVRDRENKLNVMNGPFKQRYQHAKSFYEEILQKKHDLSVPATNLLSPDASIPQDQLPSSPLISDNFPLDNTHTLSPTGNPPQPETIFSVDLSKTQGIKTSPLFFDLSRVSLQTQSEDETLKLDENHVLRKVNSI